LGYLLAREGLAPNHKKLLRIYREEGLKVRRRGGRKWALGTRAPMMLPQGLNQRWSLDIVSDALGCGRRFRILCVVDDFTRECLALVADTSLSGARVAREFVAIVALWPAAGLVDTEIRFSNRIGGFHAATSVQPRVQV
jgi:putative transposase